jgi:hypothetical protein
MTSPILRPLLQSTDLVMPSVKARAWTVPTQGSKAPIETTTAQKIFNGNFPIIHLQSKNFVLAAG